MVGGKFYKLNINFLFTNNNYYKIGTGLGKTELCKDLEKGSYATMTFTKNNFMNVNYHY